MSIFASSNIKERMKYFKILFVGCMLLTVSAVSAQENKEVADSVKTGKKSSKVKETVSKVKDAFSVKKATADALIGTWTYKEPAVYASKGNMLLRLVGNTTVSSFEKLLKKYIEKTDITPENTSMTFHEDGTFDRVIAGRKAHGVWMVNGEKLMLAVNHVQTADITTHLEDGELMLLVDADKIMNALTLLGALEDTKANKALIKVAKKVPALQGGFQFIKKK